MIGRFEAWTKAVRSRGGWRRALWLAARRPGTAIRHVGRTGSVTWIRAHFTSAAEYARLAAEADASETIQQACERLNVRFGSVRGSTPRGQAYVPGALGRGHARALYALVRKRQPRVLVETGVCNGFSTVVLLEAIAANRCGHLYSIDLPEFAGRGPSADLWNGKGGAVVPEGEMPGWLVPAALRLNWTLRLGRSVDVLPSLLRELGSLDFFLHDSEHSLENQLFEFRAAFAHLGPEGLLACSDLNWSGAFDQFWSAVRREARCTFVDPDLALVVRRDSARVDVPA